jgi:hypothetical protein
MHFSAIDETGVAINQEDAITMANAGIGYSRLLCHRKPPWVESIEATIRLGNKEHNQVAGETM